MTQIERDLEAQLEGLLASLEAGLPRAATRSYIGENLAAWGFVVSCPAPWCSCASDVERWSVVGRLGQGLPGRVRLLARIDGAAGLPAGAVLMALSQLLARYALRHAVEAVITAGLDAPRQCGEAAETAAGRLVAAVCFAGPWAAAPLRVGASGVAPGLAQGVSRLLVRYPAAVWAGPACEPAPGPCLCVGGAPRAAGDGPAGPWAGDAPSHDRMRDALMLGAEIVALLQAWPPGSGGVPAHPAEPGGPHGGAPSPAQGEGARGEGSAAPDVDAARRISNR